MGSGWLELPLPRLSTDKVGYPSYFTMRRCSLVVLGGDLTLEA
jgi:hypothetical protein